jgi:hypothetical protein
MKIALSAVRHAQWFSEKNISSIIRNCIRIIKFYRIHNDAWKILNPWVLPRITYKLNV